MQKGVVGGSLPAGTMFYFQSGLHLVVGVVVRIDEVRRAGSCHEHPARREESDRARPLGKAGEGGGVHEVNVSAIEGPDEQVGRSIDGREALAVGSEGHIPDGLPIHFCPPLRFRTVRHEVFPASREGCAERPAAADIP